MTIERALLLMMFGLLVWFSSAIIRLENCHYASQIGSSGASEGGHMGSQQAFHTDDLCVDTRNWHSDRAM